MGCAREEGCSDVDRDDGADHLAASVDRGFHHPGAQGGIAQPEPAQHGTHHHRPGPDATVGDLDRDAAARLMEPLTDIVVQAGAAILAVTRSTMQVTGKSDGSPVTEADMAARAAELATEAIERLRADGIDVADTDAQNLQAYARTVARHEAEIQTAGDAYVLAQSKVQQVQDRIAALSERAAALSALRLTGQATDRDTGEAVLIERDLQTLREALTPAQAAQARVQVPDAMQHQHQAALAALQAQERAVRLECLRTRAKAAEAAFLGAVRELVVVSGVAHPSQAFTRDPALDRFVNFGHL